MAEPTNRDQFRDYIIRRLGFPLQEINVDEEQLEERIDDAINYYRDYHYDGAQKVNLQHQLTATDVSNGYITMAEEIMSITKVLPIPTGTSTSALFNVKYHITLDALWSLSNRSLIPYYIAMQHLEMVTDMFGSDPGVRFSKHTNRLYLNAKFGVDILVGDYIVVECYRYLDPEEYSDMWKDRWLKQYATALVKRQWGENLKVFNGVQLLGGITLNGKEIYDEAVEEIRLLEEKMLNSYSLPPMDEIA